MKYLFFLLTLSTLNSVLFAQIPDGGINMLADPLSNFEKIGQDCQIKIVSITDQEFTKAIEVKTTTQPANAWNAQLKMEITESVEINDILLLTFWARTTQSIQETGEGKTTAIFEDASDYSKDLSYSTSISSSWKQYFIPFKSTKNLAYNECNMAFFVGYTPQTIEFAEIQLLNYQGNISINELPKTQISYHGREADAEWRLEAQKRIEKYRMGTININVVDKNNTPIPNAQVSIEMKKHKYAFGSAISGKVFLSNNEYQNKVIELFNEIVFENDLKWKSWYSNTSHQYITDVLDILDDNEISARGHVLVWPSFRYNPDYLQDFDTNPEKLKEEITDRINTVTQFTKGRLVDWDVINEPYANYEWMDIVGYEQMGEWFKLARENDENAKLFINDYQILSAGGTNEAHQDHYFNTIQYIDSLGGNIEGIGMQSHFSTDLTPPVQVLKILDRFGELGKQIKITEYDITCEDDQLKADYTRDFLTATFSHPSTTGFLNWGFWEGQHWKPEAAFYDENWNIRPHGEVWKDLIYKQWWTSESVETNAEGFSSLKGFLGTYECTIDGKKGQFSISDNAVNEILIKVSDELEISTNEVKTELIHLKNTGNLKLYPNPTSNITTISVSTEKPITLNMEIINMCGKVKYSTKFISNTPFLVNSELDPGIYIVHIKGANYCDSKKLIIN